MEHLTEEDAIQELQYEFPYHHIIDWDQQNFSQTKHWSWGLRYYGGLQVGIDLASRHNFTSLIDIGCGDGRFLKELRRVAPTVELKGIDISARAIRYARAFSPEIDFSVSDIGIDSPEKRWEVATLIEVCEHIPPTQLPVFLDSVARSLEPGGRLIMTVPHSNKKLTPKHYQHFSSEKLADLLAPDFEELEFIFFDSRSRLLQILLYLNGGKGRHLVVTSPFVNRLIFRLYRKYFHYVKRESDCLRIACTARKKT